MRMDKDQFRKYKSLTYSEQRKARRYMRRGMDVDDALYEADETGRFLMKILLWILFIAGVAFGGYKLVKWVLNTVAKDCTHETLTYMIAVSESTPGPIMINLATSRINGIAP